MYFISIIINFGGKIGGEYPLLLEKALNIPITFSTTYSRESGFSTIKTKAKNRLN